MTKAFVTDKKQCFIYSILFSSCNYKAFFTEKKKKTTCYEKYIFKVSKVNLTLCVAIVCIISTRLLSTAIRVTALGVTAEGVTALDI